MARNGGWTGRTMIGRRRVLGAALGVGGVAALGVGGAGWGSGATVVVGQTAPPPAPPPVPINPPVSPSLFLPEPPTRFARDGVLETKLEARPEPALGQGRLSYEGSEGGLPGPTLRLRPGDTLRVKLINNLGGGVTNLHTHGFHVSPLANGDNVFLHVENGESLDYEFVLPANHPSGHFWYHPHNHGDSMQQVASGLAGAMIVEGGLDDLPGLQGLPERLMILQGPFFGPAGIEYLINGVRNPQVAIRPGQTQRWRILNASANAFFNLQLDGQALHRLATDGNPFPNAVVSDTLLMGPGERGDILVQGGPPGTTALRSLAWGEGPQAQPDIVLATVVAGGAPMTPMPLPTTLLPLTAPLDDLTNATIDVRRQITFQMNGVAPYFAINNEAFDPDRIDQTVQLGATEEWTIGNASAEWHPFHIHVNDFQVMTDNGEPIAPHYEDTIAVPPGGQIVIRTRFLDFPGKFVYHCHILAHEDAGMMGTVEVVGTG